MAAGDPPEGRGGPRRGRRGRRRLAGLPAQLPRSAASSRRPPPTRRSRPPSASASRPRPRPASRRSARRRPRAARPRRCSRSRTGPVRTGSLFGSVTAKEIVDAVQQARGPQARPAQGAARGADQGAGHAHGRDRGRPRASRHRSRPWSWRRSDLPRRRRIRRRRCRRSLVTVAPTRVAVPPQNIEAEESVLGAMLVRRARDLAVLVDVRLRPDDFYRDSHRAIFRGDPRAERQERGGRPADRLRRAREARRARDGRRQALRAPAGGGGARPPATPATTRKLVKDRPRCAGCSSVAQTIEVRRRRAPRASRTQLVEDAERMLFEVAHAETTGRLPLDRRDPARGDRQARAALARRAGRSPARRPASATSTTSPAAFSSPT